MQLNKTTKNNYVRVSEDTHKKLSYMKLDLNHSSISDLIDTLINIYNKQTTKKEVDNL